jgi:hypothetical protein
LNKSSPRNQLFNPLKLNRFLGFFLVRILAQSEKYLK